MGVNLLREMWPSLLLTTIYFGSVYHALCLGCDVVWLSFLFDERVWVFDNINRALDNP